MNAKRYEQALNHLQDAITFGYSYIGVYEKIDECFRELELYEKRLEFRQSLPQNIEKKLSVGVIEDIVKSLVCKYQWKQAIQVLEKIKKDEQNYFAIKGKLYCAMGTKIC